MRAHEAVLNRFLGAERVMFTGACLTEANVGISIMPLGGKHTTMGPSAGAAMAAAMVSYFWQREVRADRFVTGAMDLTVRIDNLSRPHI